MRAPSLIGATSGRHLAGSNACGPIEAVGYIGFESVNAPRISPKR
jgi:hypothetical protein